MKKCNWLYPAICGLLLAANGCSLEDPFEGERCGSDANPLAYIVYQGERCDAADCANSDNCCGIEDADARALMADAFKHNTCPVNSSYDKCVQEDGVNFCSGACGKSESMCKGQCMKFNTLHIASCDENGITCKEGHADCNDDFTDGCEVNLRTLHLKSCKHGEIECADGFASCDNDIESGCETSVLGNQYNCGRCDNICKDENPYCLAGECSNKCEYDICNNVCMQLAVNHIQSCNPGNSNLVCADGYGNCDKLLENGCEIDLNNTPAHCGICGHACEEGEVCSNGDCIENKCPEETPDNCMVGGVRTCMDVHANDFNNCGSCGYRCQEHPMLGGKATSATCENGLCIYDCTPGLIRMSDEATADLIQCIDPNNDGNFCGAKSSSERGTKCLENEVCTLGHCEINDCTPPTTLCKINGTNDCINVMSDNAEHCGNCNVNCQTQGALNATSNTCAEGKCIFECNPGFVNISTGTARDTIQCVDGQNDRNHCGAESYQKPGSKCSDRESCHNGECIINECDPDSNNPDLCISGTVRACKNIHSDDADNCGSCDYKCSDHPLPNANSTSCKSGDCQYTCTGNYINISNGSTSGTINCINPLNDHDHCGTNASNIKACAANQSCSNGTCINTSCTNGQRLCDGDCIYVNDDPKNCGECNIICAEQRATNAHSNRCKSNVCQFECDENFVNVSTAVTQSGITCIDPQTNDRYCGAKSSSEQGKSCTGNSHCRDGVCVECTSDSDCSGSTPHCKTSTHTCVSCTSSSHCTNAVCSSDNQCVECASSADCSDKNKPVCHNNSCVVCAGSQGCSGATPVCLNQTSCVACINDSDCSGSTPVCNNNQCVACNGDSDCSAPLSHCQNHACVECTANSHCTVAHSTCNLSTNSCTCEKFYSPRYMGGVLVSCLLENPFACTSETECTEQWPNTTCTKSGCACAPGYIQYPRLNEDGNLYCVEKCTNMTKCTANGQCNTDSGLCECKSGYIPTYDDITGQLLRCSENTCRSNAECTDSRLCLCNTTTHKCVSQFNGQACAIEPEY